MTIVQSLMTGLKTTPPFGGFKEIGVHDVIVHFENLLFLLRDGTSGFLHTF